MSPRPDLSASALDRLPKFWLPRRPHVRILLVVDRSISLDPIDDFGLSKIIDIIRKSGAFAADAEHSYVHFEVETASRGGRARPGTADHPNIDFAALDASGQPLLNRFDQLWLFGFSPGNGGELSDDPVRDDPLALTDAEVQAIARWMNERKGGVLAMGDHHFLGASLAWRLPRVGTMRRWTNRQGVPPIDTAIPRKRLPPRERHDTNQPQNPAQADPLVAAMIPNAAERDHLPQPLEVRRFFRFEERAGALVVTRRPHPILCDRVHGVIDVFPDHPHEGWVYDDHEVELRGTYTLGSATLPEYPGAVDGGAHPVPMAIAHAHPWPEPPYEHQKSPTSVTRFGVLGAYDGHRANVGRVVVDSTWHHWFDMNLNGLHGEASRPGASTTAQAIWHKLVSYFRNCAVWLTPPRGQLAMLQYAAYWSTGTGVAAEEYHAGRPAWSLGETARDVLGQMVSPCVLSSWVGALLPRPLLERPVPSPCSICPRPELLEQAVLGGIIRELLPERARTFAAYAKGGEAELDLGALEQALRVGPRRALGELRERMERELREAERERMVVRSCLEASLAER